MGSREERLDAALEDCRRRLGRGETIAQCLATHPDEAEDLAALLPFLISLQELRQEPDAMFAHAARGRFHARLAEGRAAEEARQRATVRSSPLRLLRRLAIPLAAIAALGGSGVGLVTASADALPGSALYPIQQAHEQVELRLARTPKQQAVVQFRLANRRLNQIHKAQRLHASPAIVDQLTASMVLATERAAGDVQQLPVSARRQVLKGVAPLLSREEQLLRQERTQQIKASPAAAARHQRRLLAVEQRLYADQAPTRVPAPPRNTPARQRTATASTSTASQGS